MAQFATESIRTLALVGHGTAGKTTLAEALLVKAGAIAGGGQRRARHDRQRFRPDGKELPAFAALLAAAFRNQRHSHPPDRHAGLSGLHRPVDRRAGRRRDRRGRGQCAVRHRDDHVAHDGLGRAAAAVPPRHHQQDRRRERRPARRSWRPSSRRSAASACRSTCPPTAAAASSTASSIRPARRIFRRSRTRTGRSSTRWSRSTRT